MARGGNFKDISGMKFGKLTAVSPVASNRHGKVRWLCRCECGGTREVLGNHLRNGSTKSCGCLIVATNKATGIAKRVHGASKTDEHRIWSGMINRCTNRRDPIYERYGARGITVCKRWLKSFVAFLQDMGPRPSPLHTIERVNNDRGYCPSNCRWATRLEQARNRRSTRRLTYNGTTLTMTEWAVKIGMDRGTLWRRLKRGWPIAKALTEPLIQGRPRHAKHKEGFH